MVYNFSHCCAALRAWLGYHRNSEAPLQLQLLNSSVKSIRLGGQFDSCRADGWALLNNIYIYIYIALLLRFAILPTALDGREWWALLVG